MKKEVWLPVIGYEGLYEVSNIGRVRSLSRRVNCRSGGKRKIRERILKSGVGSNGYHTVVLHGNGTTPVPVHRLVAAAFIPNPENKKTINHKNGVRVDNKIENLEWATYSEQGKHSFFILGGKHDSQAKITKEDVVKIRDMYDGSWGCIAKIAKLFSITGSTCHSIIRRKTWKKII